MPKSNLGATKFIPGKTGTISSVRFAGQIGRQVPSRSVAVSMSAASYPGGTSGGDFNFGSDEPFPVDLLRFMPGQQGRVDIDMPKYAHDMGQNGVPGEVIGKILDKKGPT